MMYIIYIVGGASYYSYLLVTAHGRPEGRVVSSLWSDVLVVAKTCHFFSLFLNRGRMSDAP